MTAPRGRPFTKGDTRINPGGRPKADREVIEACRLHGVAIIAELARLFFKTGNVAAGIEILNRGYGKARQTVELTGDGGGPVVVSDVRAKLAGKLAALLAEVPDAQNSGPVRAKARRGRP